MPEHSPLPLELAVFLGMDEKEEADFLKQKGWLLKDSRTISATPEAYRNYIQGSYGEFSCAKPSCIRLQNAWISDRTICYLASGKPAIVRHTGPSRFLPERTGILRFRDFNDAVSCLEEAATNYDKHASLACELAEEYFDAERVAKSLLERVMN